MIYVYLFAIIWIILGYTDLLYVWKNMKGPTRWYDYLIVPFLGPVSICYLILMEADRGYNV